MVKNEFSSKLQFRFSLRVLIVFTMLAAIAVYFLVQPSRIAKQFADRGAGEDSGWAPEHT